MAADVGTLLMQVEANTKDFDKKMGKVNSTLKGVGKAALIGGAVVAGAFAAIAVKSVKLAAEQEKAEARLESIAKKVTMATDEQIRSMKDLAAATQEVSTFGDEVLITGQSQLLSFGLQADQVEDLTGSLADLLAANKGVNATTEDAIGAANLLGKAFSGQVGALSKVGILLDDSQAEIIKNGTAAEKTAALVDIMNQNYGGLAETLSQTTEGQMKQARNSIGDIGESIGNIFLPMVNSALSLVQNNLPQIEATFLTVFTKISEAINLFSEFARVNLLPILKNVYEFIQDNWPTIKQTFVSVFSAMWSIVKSVWSILNVTLFPVLRAVFNFINDNSDTIRKVFVGAFEGIAGVLKKAADGFNKLIGWIKGAHDWLINFSLVAEEQSGEVNQSMKDMLYTDGMKKRQSQYDDLMAKQKASTEGAKTEVIDYTVAVEENTIAKEANVVATEKSTTATKENNEEVENALTLNERLSAQISKERSAGANQRVTSGKASRAATSEFNDVYEANKESINEIARITGSDTGTATQQFLNFNKQQGNTVAGSRAFGGNVQAGESYLVGERGKEIFTPNQSGTIEASGGSVTININGTTDPNAIMNKVVQVLRQNNIINR